MANAPSSVESRATSPLFPFLDLKAEYAEMKAEIRAAVDKVLESQQFIMGPQVREFESEIAALVGSKFALGCASGSDALLLPLMALGIDSGDEVVTTPFTFVATAGTISRLKAKPVFVDIDPATYNLDAKLLESAITARTRAIIPVHLFGLPAEMETITAIARAHGVPVIEDAAQSIGASYRGQNTGSIGEFGCFSFFPSKNLGGAGDGGMVTTNDSELAERVAVLRDHGSRKKYHYDLLGMNSRLDTLQAAILLVKLRYLEPFIKDRQQKRQALPGVVRASGTDRADHAAGRTRGSAACLPSVRDSCSATRPVAEVSAGSRHSHGDLLSFPVAPSARVCLSRLHGWRVSSRRTGQPASAGASRFSANDGRTTEHRGARNSRILHRQDLAGLSTIRYALHSIGFRRRFCNI